MLQETRSGYNGDVSYISLLDAEITKKNFLTQNTNLRSLYSVSCFKQFGFSSINVVFLVIFKLSVTFVSQVVPEKVPFGNRPVLLVLGTTNHFAKNLIPIFFNEILT